MIPNFGRLRLILVGDAGVGKTNLITAWTERVILKNKGPTIGIDFGTKQLNLGDLRLRIQIWDTAGQEMFRSLIQSYYKDATIIFYVFNPLYPKTFESIKNFWYKESIEHGPLDSLRFLIATHDDLKSNWVISDKQSIKLASELDMTYLKVNGMSVQNVDNMFSDMIDWSIPEILNKQNLPGLYWISNNYIEDPIYQNKRVFEKYELEDAENSHSKSCCK